MIKEGKVLPVICWTSYYAYFVQQLITFSAKSTAIFFESSVSNLSISSPAFFCTAAFPIEDICCYLGHNDIATTRTYIMNNQGKQKTSKQIVNALSEMNGSDVLMGTQNSRNEKSPEPF